MKLAISILIEVAIALAWFYTGYIWSMRNHYKKLAENALRKLEAVEKLSEVNDQGKISPEMGYKMIIQFFTSSLEEWTPDYLEFYHHELAARIKLSESEETNVSGKAKRGRPARSTNKATVSA